MQYVNVHYQPCVLWNLGAAYYELGLSMIFASYTAGFSLIQNLNILSGIGSFTIQNLNITFSHFITGGENLLSSVVDFLGIFETRRNFVSRLPKLPCPAEFHLISEVLVKYKRKLCALMFALS